MKKTFMKVTSIFVLLSFLIGLASCDAANAETTQTGDNGSDIKATVGNTSNENKETEIQKSPCELNGHTYTTCNTCDICQYTIPENEDLWYDSDIDNIFFGITNFEDEFAKEAYVPAFISGRKVTMIDYTAFRNRERLQTLVLPNTIEKIGMAAFWGCKSLTDFKIPDSVTMIEESAFGKCNSFTSIALPDGLIHLGEYAFQDCTSLKSVEIGNGLTALCEGTFSGCTSLSTIKFDGTKAEWNAIEKGKGWDYSTGNYTVKCTDGEITK